MLAPSSPHWGEGGSRSEPGEGVTTPAYTITAETDGDVPAREALLDRAMGPGRKRKSSEKLRRGRRPAEGLAFVARDDAGTVVATVRLWNVGFELGRDIPPPLTPPLKGEGDADASESPSPLRGGVRGGGSNFPAAALLLGPLAVDPSLKNAGLGSALMRHAIQEAARLGHRAILLVGDAPYYARFGFSADRTGELSMPGPYERHRFLALELVEGALDGACGTLRATGRKVKAERLPLAA